MVCIYIRIHAYAYAYVCIYATGTPRRPPAARGRAACRPVRLGAYLLCDEDGARDASPPVDDGRGSHDACIVSPTYAFAHSFMHQVHMHRFIHAPAERHVHCVHVHPPHVCICMYAPAEQRRVHRFLPHVHLLCMYMHQQLRETCALCVCATGSWSTRTSSMALTLTPTLILPLTPSPQPQPYP